MIETISKLIKRDFQSDVAFEKSLGLKPKTVSNWKRGLSTSYLKMIPQLCETFNVSTDYLLGRAVPTAAELQQSVSPEVIEMLEKIKDLSPEKRAQVRGYLDSLKIQ